jgi:parvulin-like peptidyl-prolyl isomerase
MEKVPPLALWIAAGIIAGITVFMLISFSGATETASETIPVIEESDRQILASVGSHVLYATDLALIRTGEGAVDAWVEDQLLACAAEDAGLENPAVSRFVQERAKQLYLRDLMLQHIAEAIPLPAESAVLAQMQSNPELFLVERHYYEIIVADSILADSILTRLREGQNFSLIAQNISLGQKAAIGGDLGFVTGAGMLMQGLPMEIALLGGLSELVPSSIGWQIYTVSETRALTDSVRAIRSAAEYMQNQQFEAALDSVLQAEENSLSVEVNN